MAKFSMHIDSDDEIEMSALMVRLFSGHTPAYSERQMPAAARASKAAPVEEVVEEEVAKPAPKPRAKPALKVVEAEREDEREVVEEDAADEITLAMVKAAGSQAMSNPAIKSSGVAAILKEFGDGAESFGAIDEKYYLAVYNALTNK